MNKYIVTISESLDRDVVVEAENEWEAEEIIEKKYRNQEIVLGAEDYIGAEVYVTRQLEGDK